MPGDHTDEFDVGEITRSTSHEAAARSWETFKQVPTGNSAYLLMLVGENAPRMFPVGHAVSVGRSAAASVVIDDESVSRMHARVTALEDGRFRLEDLGSHNGTRVNGELIQEQVLCSGDRIQFGSSTIFLVTYHTRLEDQLLEIKKLESEGRLAAGLALNLRSMLKPLIAQADVLQSLLETPDLDRAQAMASAAEVSRAARRAQDLTQQLLSFARSGEYREHEVDLSDLLRDSVRMIPQPINRAIRIDTDIAAGLKILGDGLHLTNAMMHITDNTLDAMPEGGVLRITAQRVPLDAHDRIAFPLLAADEAIEITIKDTGVGMHPEVLRRALEPFYSTKPTREGAGLGLAIVDRIVKSHRGHVELKSAVGKGTTVLLYLPATGTTG